MIDKEFKAWETDNNPTENINDIDMECNCCDDDDSFVVAVKQEIKCAAPSPFKQEDTEIMLDRDPWGITVDFRDDDEGWIEKPLTVQTEQDIINAKNNLLGKHAIENAMNSENGFSGINDIDMECDCCDDDDCVPDEVPVDDDEDDFYRDPELIDEEMIEERKTTTQGEVEADYLAELQKKHAKTNKKGAYNTHFHFAGDPEKEMKLFNHDMKAALPTNSNIGDAGSTNADSLPSFGGEGACCEDLHVEVTGDKSTWDKLLNSLCKIIGISIEKTDSDNLHIKDNFGYNSDVNCNKDELRNELQPYVNDCVICPLQVATGENFKNCEDWCKWYTPEMQKKYPQCADDINYCDLCANHLHECKL